MLNIKSQIESLLFISIRPVALKELAKIFNLEKGEVYKMIDELMEKYNNSGSGIHILRKEEWKPDDLKFQMVTNPSNACLVQDFIKEDMRSELTRPALETLTIIAYRGPVSKTEIEAIRGINCSLILKNLLMRGLVEFKEDKENMISYYNITVDFMRYLGINDVRELPDYEKLSREKIIDEILLSP